MASARSTPVRAKTAREELAKRYARDAANAEEMSKLAGADFPAVAAALKALGERRRTYAERARAPRVPR